MGTIRIDNEPELKIEDTMQVKGRRATYGYFDEPRCDYESRLLSAAQTMGIAETLGVGAQA